MDKNLEIIDISTIRPGNSESGLQYSANRFSYIDVNTRSASF